MGEKNIGSLLVEEKGEITGIVTESDITNKIVARGENPEKTTVEEIKSHPSCYCRTRLRCIRSFSFDDTTLFKRLIVVGKGKIIGIISTNLIVRNLKNLLEE